MNNRIDIPNWYQLDFDISTAKITLQGISKLMKELININSIDKWFYLFEGSTIRVRMYTSNARNLEKTVKENALKMNLTISLQHPFEGYWETTDAFAGVEVAERFADIMSSLTALTITRLDGKQFSNYKLVERLSHCIFNNTYGSDTEIYLLLKRLGVDFQSQDNPEQTVLDDNQKYAIGNLPNFSIQSFKIPTK